MSSSLTKLGPPCRIISAPPEEAEKLINELWEDYTVITNAISTVGDRVIFTAVLVSQKEIRNQQLAAVRSPVGLRH